jgi:hypothetical protein
MTDIKEIIAFFKFIFFLSLCFGSVLSMHRRSFGEQAQNRLVHITALPPRNIA